MTRVDDVFDPTPATKKVIVQRSEILRGMVGSQAYGTAHVGSGDRDEMSVYIEPPEFICGLNNLESFVYRDAPQGERSKEGDLDLTAYSLRKFVSLCYHGNPTVMEFLWLPNHINITPWGRRLIAMRSAFQSRHAGKRYLGYMKGRVEKMTGQRTHTVNRPDLVAAHGYDTKFAMHALRLGFMGLEYMRTARLTIPIPDPAQAELRGVRAGLFPEDHVLKRIDEVMGQLREATDACIVKHADHAAINHFLTSEYTSHWKEHGLI